MENILITGITGQDGILVKNLLKNNNKINIFELQCELGKLYKN